MPPNQIQLRLSWITEMIRWYEPVRHVAPARISDWLKWADERVRELNTQPVPRHE